MPEKVVHIGVCATQELSCQDQGTRLTIAFARHVKRDSIQPQQTLQRASIGLHRCAKRSQDLIYPSMKATKTGVRARHARLVDLQLLRMRTLVTRVHVCVCVSVHVCVCVCVCV